MRSSATAGMSCSTRQDRSPLTRNSRSSPAVTSTSSHGRCSSCSARSDRRSMSIPRVPSATYRLQLTPEFDFTAAADVVPYLAALGISHVYCSPVFEAAAGSTHGYDVVDPARLRSELGGAAGFAALVRACHEHKLGLVVDVVPNHMYVGAPQDANVAWWDVLRRGQDSPFAKWFDIDWRAP